MGPCVEESELIDTPQFRNLVRLRTKLAARCAVLAVGSLLMVVILMRLAPGLLGMRVGNAAHFTVGMLASVGVFICCIVAAVGYVRAANTELEPALRAVRQAGLE